jgi:hypothetical protein
MQDWRAGITRQVIIGDVNRMPLHDSRKAAGESGIRGLRPEPNLPRPIPVSGGSCGIGTCACSVHCGREFDVMQDGGDLPLETTR